MSELSLVPPTDVEGAQTEWVKPEEVPQIMADYVPAMTKIVTEKKGLGLAAPQVGIKKKFFLVLNLITGKYEVVFNAFCLKGGNSIVVATEGCLTYGEGATNQVKRFKDVQVVDTVLDGKGGWKKRNRLAHRDKAIMFQHEIDHLNGMTIFTKRDPR